MVYTFRLDTQVTKTVKAPRSSPRGQRTSSLHLLRDQRLEASHPASFLQRRCGARRGAHIRFDADMRKGSACPLSTQSTLITVPPEPRSWPSWKILVYTRGHGSLRWAQLLTMELGQAAWLLGPQTRERKGSGTGSGFLTFKSQLRCMLHM